MLVITLGWERTLCLLADPGFGEVTVVAPTNTSMILPIATTASDARVVRIQ